MRDGFTMDGVNDIVALAGATAGWIGAASTVVAYALVTQRRLAPDSLRFQAMNLAGAGLLAISSARSGAWPSAATNIVWMLIGVQAVIAARHLVRAAVHRRVQALASMLRLHHAATGRRGSVHPGERAATGGAALRTQAAPRPADLERAMVCAGVNR